MESERFDQIVRGAVAGVSRRGALQFGAGALAAAVMATPGPWSGETEAGHRNRKNRRKRKKQVCRNGSIVRSRKVRDGDLDLCGTGCCPDAFPVCCAVNDRPDGQSCSPADYACCGQELGGGSCGGPFPKCCAPTSYTPFGWCAEAVGQCCTEEQGGGACNAGTVCCPLSKGGSCCPDEAACCSSNDDCGEGFHCSNGCCEPRGQGGGGGGHEGEVTTASIEAHKGGAERFRMTPQ